MPEEYFDVAYINFDEAILHGRMMSEKRDEHGFRQEIHVRQTLTDEQKRAIEDMNSDHHKAMQRLLASFAKGHPNA